MKTSLLFLAAAVCASAQVQFLVVDAPGSEKAVSGLYQFSSAPVGDRTDVVFRIRNTAQTTLSIRSLTLAGAGFSMFGQPTLPFNIAPGLNMDFTVRFAPADFGSYSANLTANGVSLMLIGASTAAPTLSAEGVALQSGSAVDLGLVERGVVATKRFRLENTTSERVQVKSLAVSGRYFQLGGSVAAPVELQPRSAVEFDVSFNATTSGVFQGTLSIDGRDYRITGAAHEPPFPKPVIIVDLAERSSAQQGTVKVQFGTTSRAIGSGKLRMEFKPTASTAPDDEAIRFIKGNRNIAFDVTEGMTVPVTATTFQTGTTAGTIVFTAEVGGWTTTETVEIAPAIIRVDKAKAVRNGSMLEIEVTAFDNTRTAGTLSFTFYTTTGEVVPPGAIRVDQGAEFRRFYADSTLGGSFTLKAAFPVAGPIANIASVDVALTNSAGPAQTGKTPIQ